MRLKEVAKSGFEVYRTYRSPRSDKQSYGKLGQQRTRNQDTVYRLMRRFFK